MKRRIIAAVAAVLLAVIGGASLYLYVSGANHRAMAGLETTQVLVVTKPVTQGTPSDQLKAQVTSKELPQTAVVPGAVSSLDQIKGLVATADIQPGEQVIASRFADPATLADAQSAPVAKGLQEVSLQLNQAQALGGNIVPGDTVGMFFSIESKIGTETVKQTHLTFHRVLVSRVQGGLAPLPEDDKNADKAQAMPDGRSLMVTLAVTAPQAEKIVFAAENGSIWLSHESADADQRGTQIVTEGKLYQ